MKERAFPLIHLTYDRPVLLSLCKIHKWLFHSCNHLFFLTFFLKQQSVLSSISGSFVFSFATSIIAFEFSIFVILEKFITSSIPDSIFVFTFLKALNVHSLTLRLLAPSSIGAVYWSYWSVAICFYRHQLVAFLVHLRLLERCRAFWEFNLQRSSRRVPSFKL